MKKILVFTGKALTSSLLAFCLVAGSIMCLVTAFALRVNVEALLLTLAGLCLFWVLISHLPKGWKFLPVLVGAAMALRLYVNLDELTASLQLIYTVLRGVYTSAYAWVLPEWAPPPGAYGTMALIVLGVLLTLITALCIHKGRSILFPLLLDAVPLFLCLVVVDTPPEPFWRNLFLVGLGVALLSQPARRLRTGGTRLTWLVAPVVLGLVLVTQWFLPSEDYRRSEFGQTMLSNLLDWASQVAIIDTDTVFGELDIHVPVTSVESLSIGPRDSSDRTIIEVRGQHNGNLYLRGTTYGIYTGDAWSVFDDQLYEALPPGDHLTARNTAQLASVSLRTRYVESVIYTPYYLGQLPNIGQAWADVCIENTDKLREYAVTYYTELSVEPNRYLAEYNAATGQGTVLYWNSLTQWGDDKFTGMTSGGDSTMSTSSSFSGYDSFVYENYTRLPDSTRVAALYSMSELGLDLEWLQSIPAADAVSAVTAAVRDSAEYDLNTPRMPDEHDFAIWFLRESDTGYCVHFASAATVLLRSLGIPARYVTGYLVNAEPGKWVPVSEQNAHAWAEYYIPGLGWLPLEATPGTGVFSTANPGLEETEPIQTVETTEATEPSEVDETTAPTVTESTTETTAPTTASKPNDPNTNSPGQNQRKPIKIPAWVWYTAIIIVLLCLYRPLVRKLRERRLARLDPKTRFLSRWRQLCRLADLLKEPVCHEELAEKARFSLHEPTDDELEALDIWQARLLTALRSERWYIRFLCKWILVWT